MAIQKIVTDDALSAFASDVKAAIANVSSPLVYKGTLGTGGTISTLPAASASNNGFAYVVITAGTYQGVVCAVGDVIASNGTAWNIIPQANSAETLPITNGSAVNTKEYIDDKTTLVKSASGSLVHITDGGDNIPMKSLESEIVAVESGSGEKSPTNPYTISGFNSGVVSVCGKNLLKNGLTSQTYNGITFTVNSDGTITLSGTATAEIYRTFHIYLPKGSYIFSSGVTESLSTYDTYIAKDGTTIARGNSILPGPNFTLTEFSDLVLNIRVRNGVSPNTTLKLMARVASDTDDTFVPYNGTTYIFTFGQTVYGGHFDNKGNLVVTHDIVDLGTLTWGKKTDGAIPYFRTTIPDSTMSISVRNFICSNYKSVPFGDIYSQGQNQKCTSYNGGLFIISDNDYSDAPAFKTAMNGVMLVYELATPITLSITSQDIPTLSGENNIFSNCGDTAIGYFTISADDLAALIEVLSNS